VRLRLGENRDVRDTLAARHQAQDQGGHREARRRDDHDDDRRRDDHPRAYNKRRGGRYDSDEDRSRSPTPDFLGPRAFGSRVLNAPFPQRFRPPTSVQKYNGETNPSVWLEDYRLACRAGGADDDFFIIRHLPLYLADSARAWLEHLPPRRINGWPDLRDVFIGNFQGTYVRPGNPWDLRNCKQRKGESLRDYIRRFSKQCNELPGATDSEVISAFTFGTTCESLVHELGRRQPKSAKGLLDLATNHATGEEAVAAIIRRDADKGKEKEAGAGVEASSSRPKKKKNKQRHDPDFVAVADKQKGSGKAPRPQKDHFERLLEAPCINHEGPVNHKLRDCKLMKSFLAGTLQMKGAAGRQDDRPDNQGDDGNDVYREDGAVNMIFGGPAAYESKRQQKLTRREVLFTEPAVPRYLRWSEAPITFDKADHPDYIPQPGRFPLVVDPIVGTKRLGKVLMDGGSGLNLLYADTLDAMGIPRARLRPSSAPIHGVVPGKQAVPLGQIDLPVTFGSPSNFRKETLTFEVVPFKGTYHALLGRPCYAKFMAVPNYTYLKLKIPGPKGVITVSSTYERALQCDQECVRYATALIESDRILPDLVAWARADHPKENEKVEGSFESDKDSKEVVVDGEGHAMRVGTELSPK
jgi:hypothetical protein